MMMRQSFQLQSDICSITGHLRFLPFVSNGGRDGVNACYCGASTSLPCFSSDMISIGCGLGREGLILISRDEDTTVAIRSISRLGATGWVALSLKLFKLKISLQRSTNHYDNDKQEYFQERDCSSHLIYLFL